MNTVASIPDRLRGWLELAVRSGGYRIITVEEPIEYVFQRSANSVVTQREVGIDVLTFADGLKSGLRQDPDAILVGEIRDRDTAQMARALPISSRRTFSRRCVRNWRWVCGRW